MEIGEREIVAGWMQLITVRIEVHADAGPVTRSRYLRFLIGCSFHS